MMRATIKQLISIYREHILNTRQGRKYLVAMTVVAFFATFFSFLTPVFSGLIIDAIERKSTGALTYLCAMSLAALAALLLFRIAQNYITSKFIAQLSFRMKQEVLESSLSRTPSFYDEYKSGEILFRIYNDTAIVSEKLVLLPTNFVISVLFLGVSLLTVVIIDWRIFVATVMMLLACSIASLLLQKHGKIRSRLLQEKGEELYALSQDQIANVDSIHLNCTVDQEVKKNASQMSEFATAYLKKNVFFGNSEISLSALNSLWTTGILFIGGNAVVAGGMSIGSLVYCLMLVGILMPFCRNIQECILYVSTYLMMYDRRTRVVSYPGVDFGDLSLVSPIGSGAICIRNLSFAYPNSGKSIFRDFTLETPANKITCITGPSGIGKSTLLKILLKLELGYGGLVTIDGINIASISVRDLRSVVRFSGNRPKLFTGTIKDNITYGCDRFDDEAIGRVIEIAQLSDYISALPDGIYSYVGSENGISLSEGEAQRVMLARCLLSEPKLLLLDEATSNVDIATNKKILNGLRKELSHCSVVMVSHSREIEEEADCIIRLGE